MALPDFIEQLRTPDRYGHPLDRVEVIQTHISWVLIAGEYVYKIKKPVDFGFLDFTSLEKRAYYCRRELELNRRLCPDIYLDRVAITRANGECRVGGDGEVVDYAVKMRRLPQRRMMGTLLERDEVGEHDIEAIIRTLVPFYRAAAGGRRIQSHGTAQAVSISVRENFEQTEPFIGGAVLSRARYRRIRAYTRSVLEDEARFAKRIEAGRIRDCHGDLYSANICLADRVHVFDCIEFNDRLRYSDVAADIAFLAMDLDYYGCSDLARFLVSRFAVCSGDADLFEQVGFYKCYRAYVRGKIGLFTSADPAVDEDQAERSAKQAERYFHLADRYAEEHT